MPKILVRPLIIGICCILIILVFINRAIDLGDAVLIFAIGILVEELRRYEKKEEQNRDENTGDYRT